MRKLASLCRRLSRTNSGYYAVVKDGRRYLVYKGINSRMDLSNCVFEGSSVSEVEWFLLGEFLED